MGKLRGWGTGARGRAAAAAALAVALATAAGAATSSAAPAHTGAAAQAAKAAAPSTVKIGFDSTAQTLDPNKATYPPELAAINLIGLNLMEGNSSSKPKPYLAQSLRPSLDGLTWTATLRQGVKFSDGTPVTSADVKASFDRVIDDKAAVNSGSVATIASVDAPSPDTVVIHLKKRTPDLPTLLTAQFLSIWPAEGLAKGDSFFNAPYSGGPYKLQSWGGGQTVTLVANDSFFGGHPSVRTLEFDTVDDPATRLAQVQAGQLTAAIDIPANVLKQVQKPVHAAFVPYYYGISALIPRDTDPLMKDVRIRQAINLAIDRNQLNKIAFNGLVKPLAGFWPQGTPGYDPHISTQPNYAKAKALLRGTKCQNGCTLTVTFSTSYKDWGPQAGVIFRNDLKKIGINVKIDMIDPAVATKRYFSGKFQSRIGTTAAQVNTATAILTPALKSNGGVQANFSGYRSAKMDRLINQLAALPASRQLPLMKKISALFERDRPYIMLANGGFFVISRVPNSQLLFLPNFSFRIPGA